MRLPLRMSRYAQVGLLCAVINNAIVIAMDALGYRYTLSIVVGFLVVMIVGYRLHAGYTFGVRRTRSGWVRFTSANLTGFPLSMGAMYLLCDRLGLSASLAMPIATVLLLSWNYLLAYLIIARPERRTATS